MSDTKVKCLDCAQLHNGYCPVRAMIVAAQSDRICRFYVKQKPKKRRRWTKAVKTGREGSDVHED